MDRLIVEDPDRETVEAAQRAPEGDLRAFEELVLRHQKRVLANCKYLTRDDANYEDLAQDVFVKAFFGLKTFEGRSTFQGWVKKIKVNHCLTHMKKQAGKLSSAIEEGSEEKITQLQVGAVAELNVQADEQRRSIEEVLGAMPDTLRVPLVMCDMDEMSYEEVAAALGLGLSAVKMRIKRGREMFRERYEGQMR
jgi:RNA polymerase sigma-70 factor (ECF subfamily)